MAEKITLHTRTETLVKPTFLSLMFMSEAEKQQIEDKKMLVPERVLYECYSKLIGKDSKFSVKEIVNCTLSCDDVFPQIPMLVYKDQLIQKENIASFLKQITTIDDKFFPSLDN